jgi:hypothetical protein
MFLLIGEIQSFFLKFFPSLSRQTECEVVDFVCGYLGTSLAVTEVY